MMFTTRNKTTNKDEPEMTNQFSDDKRFDEAVNGYVERWSYVRKEN